MKPIYFLILSILLFSSSIHAQGEFVVEYDLTNGTFHKINQKIDDVTYIVPGYNTYNENSGIFYFVSSLEKKGIYAIDTENGEELYFHLDKDLKAIEYSHTLDKLLCIRSDQSINKKFLSTVNFTTGQVTDISDPIESSSMYQGYDSFNEKDTVYTFLAPSNILYSIHAVTGEILHQPVIQTQAGENIQHLEYYQNTGELYSLMSIGTGSAVVLGKINPETGSITKSNNTHSDLKHGGSAAMDQTNGYYIYKYRDGGNNNVVALDIITGNIVFNQPFAVTAGDNLIDIEYDNKKQKLYSKHWDALITNVENINNFNLQITPNPTSDFLIVENLELDNHSYYYDLKDNTGNSIIRKSELRTPEISLPKLATGIYFITIYSNNQRYNSKVVIQN